MSDGLVKQPIEWVENDEDLNLWCERWQNEKLLAIDTEFMRSQTYYPIAALVQVNNGVTNVLIDPTKITDFSFFAELMESNTIIKALHSCSEDLEVFHRILGIIPKRIFDTQIAASALGYGFSVGYGNIVRACLDVDLPKGETRSNWLQRPLSQPQILYAAIDVEYLYVLASRFLADLEKCQRTAWIEAECDTLLKSYAESLAPERAYLRVKTAWKLNAQQLACLIKLCEWRERKAQDRNVPRNRVVKENGLFQVAMQLPQQVSLLRKYEGFTDRMITADGAAVIAIVEQVKQLPDDELPHVLPRPPSGSETKKIKRLRDKVIALAERENIAPELLVKKKDYEFVVQNAEQVENALPKSLQGWRKAVVGNALLQWCATLNAEVSGAEEPADSERGL